MVCDSSNTREKCRSLVRSGKRNQEIQPHFGKESPLIEDRSEEGVTIVL